MTAGGPRAAAEVFQGCRRGRLAVDHRPLPALAGSVPRGEIRLVDAGHVTMHLRHPGTVLQAIQDLAGPAGPAAGSSR